MHEGGKVGRRHGNIENPGRQAGRRRQENPGMWSGRRKEGPYLRDRLWWCMNRRQGGGSRAGSSRQARRQVVYRQEEEKEVCGQGKKWAAEGRRHRQAGVRKEGRTQEVVGQAE